MIHKGVAQPREFTPPIPLVPQASDLDLSIYELKSLLFATLLCQAETTPADVDVITILWAQRDAATPATKDDIDCLCSNVKKSTKAIQ